MEKPKNQNTGWSIGELREKIKEIVAPSPRREKVTKAGRKRGRGFTKAPHNFKRAKMRRKMAKASRRINRARGVS